MTTRVFRWIAALAAVGVGVCASAQSSVSGGTEIERRLESSHDDVSPMMRLVALSPAPEQLNRVLLEGPEGIDIALDADERSVRITARDGSLVTLPPQILSLADVKAIVAPNGDAATVLHFPVKVEVAVVEHGEGGRFYEIKGPLLARRWGTLLSGGDFLSEVLSPRSSTSLGDLFRVIGTIVDLSAGAMLDDPKLSDEELIRRLSAEVVRLRIQIRQLKTGLIEAEGYKASPSALSQKGTVYQRR